MKLALFVAAAFAVGGCGRGGPESAALHVYAASSLTDAFRDLERAFEARHPGVAVTLTFAGSQVLRLQIEQGASADVFASADPGHMEALVDAGWIRESRVLAQNELVLIVPLENPAAIESFADLPKAERLVVGSPNGPVGRYTQEVLARAGTRLGRGFEASVVEKVVSEESNVRLVRAKVELGEADAAIVYRTDALRSELVRFIPVPDDYNVTADYLIGVVSRSPNSQIAEEWMAFLESNAARQILVGHGFRAS